MSRIPPPPKPLPRAKRRRSFDDCMLEQLPSPSLFSEDETLSDPMAMIKMLKGQHARILDELEGIGVPAFLVGADVLRARGWVHAAAGDLETARTVARTAADSAESATCTTTRWSSRVRRSSSVGP